MAAGTPEGSDVHTVKGALPVPVPDGRRVADLEGAAHRLREGTGDHEAEARARLRRAFVAEPVKRG